MRFEHIVQINDLTKPELPTLTRFQLWEGLVLRALRPIPSAGVCAHGY